MMFLSFNPITVAYVPLKMYNKGTKATKGGLKYELCKTNS